MVKNIESSTKFLMYPRFLQLLINKHKKHLLPHTEVYPRPSLNQKVFSNIKMVINDFPGVVTSLFDNMILQE